LFPSVFTVSSFYLYFLYSLLLSFSILYLLFSPLFLSSSSSYLQVWFASRAWWDRLGRRYTIVPAPDTDEKNGTSHIMLIGRGNKYTEKTSANFCTINPTLTDLAFNPDRRSEKMETNRPRRDPFCFLVHLRVTMPYKIGENL
jgi:hypothetical protein